ncbi:MAG TPA: peptidylprolyl isomerase [Mycobacteriales bacterium]|nr:peptidylprolyl isomerase [Mycobacteriales bacterium]
MRTRRVAALLIPVAAVVAGCGSSSSGGSAAIDTSPSAAQVSPTPSSTATNANGCTPPPALQTTHQSYSSEPAMTISPTTYTATIVTNCGTIVIALDGKHAPHTVNSFNFLAGKGFFNDTKCHRLTTEGIYVLQCGDPTGTGSGGPGYTFTDEYLNDPALGKPRSIGGQRAVTYPAGIVAMANSGPDTNGSQFFLVFRNSPLAPAYTPFGRITSGLDVVKRIAAAGSTPPGDGAPNQPVVIESFTVSKGAPAGS